MQCIKRNVMAWSEQPKDGMSKNKDENLVIVTETASTCGGIHLVVLVTHSMSKATQANGFYYYKPHLASGHLLVICAWQFLWQMIMMQNEMHCEQFRQSVQKLYINFLLPSEWVSSFLMAHQHKIGHSVPQMVKKN